MTFLAERILTGDTTRVFVVVNFMDQVRSTSERNSLERAVTDRLGRLRLSAEPHYISADQAFWAIDAMKEVMGRDPDPTDIDELHDSGVPALQEAIARFLTTDRQGLELERQQRALKKLADDLRHRLKSRARALQLDEERVRRQAERLNQLATLVKGEGQGILDKVEQRLDFKEGERWMLAIVTGVTGVCRRPGAGVRAAASRASIPTR
ncbi:MAG: hypothetical protein KC912_23765 [Proteobacteria bacterium]|nr:hypothetical protein [Pseudomonadota bacterium]